ncbi:MAG: hypothetical protein N3E51_03255 [Candidatus Micrarchaeota archaeon]|nr:hypothetical protein [Candidatus Micrarchaeota archaeon]
MDFILYGAQNFFQNPAIIAAFGIAAFITALSYMMSEIFSMPSLKAFSKLELRELAVSAIIVIICILLTIPNGIFDKVGHGLVPKTAGMPKSCPEWTKFHGELRGDPINGYYYEKGNFAIGQADYFIGCRWSFWDIIAVGVPYALSDNNGVLLPALVGRYLRLMIFEILSGFLGTLSIEINVMIWGVPQVEFEIHNIILPIFFSFINEANTVIVDLLGTLIGGAAAQKILLNFIDLTALNYFLPLGILMRVFPFTRKTGSTIVAVAFAAYFIFPLTILLNWHMWNMVDSPPLCSDPAYKKVGESCQTDQECCTNSCYEDKCQPAVSDFLDATSSFLLCEEAIDNPALSSRLETILSEEGKKEEEYISKLKNEKLAQNDPSTKTQVRLKRDMEEKDRIGKLNEEQYDRGTQNVFIQRMKDATGAIVSAGPRFAFRQFEHATAETGKLLALMFLFIINSIVVTLTLLKDFSILIGGEPRLLGITKLV